jgi:mannose-6-phosphate isomerase-like protein (cupin superfamily)
LTLSALAQALGVPISALVDSATPSIGRIRVVRASERAETVDPISGAWRDNVGAPLTESKIEPTRYVILPHTVAGSFAAHARGTIEHMHLAAGNIRAVFGTDAVMLDAGDSCSRFTDTPHHFDSREGEVEALIYIAVEHP